MRYCLMFLGLLMFWAPNDVSAQAGCPCGIIKSSINSAHSKTRAKINSRIGDMEDEIVDALKKQTKQLSAGQEKQLAALEQISDALMEGLRRMEAEGIQRNAAYDRAATKSGCLAATSGNRLKHYGDVGDQTKDQITAKYGFWNDGEGRSDQSNNATAVSAQSHLENLPIDSAGLGSLLMGQASLSDEELENLTLKTQLLTNPKPTPLPKLDGSSENAESYLSLQHMAQVRSIVQQYFADRGGRYRGAYDVAEWYKDATGTEPPDKVSIMSFLFAEGERRYTSKEWHGEQKQSNLALMQREANTMQAFELFMRVQEFKQGERIADLLATLVSIQNAQ